MLVLIPNPNQMIELLNAQKAFIQQNNRADGPIFYQSTPLWIFAEPGSKEFSRDFLKDELKKFAADIQKVELEHPQVYFSTRLQQIVLGCHSRISINSRILQGELILCNSAKVATPPTTYKCTEPSLKNFQMQLKVFRVANAVQPDAHSMAITDFVWKKLKP